MSFGTVPRNDPDGLFGFDASIYVHEIDWKLIESAGHFKFGFIECASELKPSIPFKTIWNDAARSMPCAPYQRISTANSGKTYATAFISDFMSAAVLKDTDLPPVLDVEADRDGHIGKPEFYLEAMDDWIEMIEARFKRRPIIYTGPWFWRHIGSPTKYEKHPLWIANYCVPRPDVPAPWQGYHFWQYAQNASSAGFGSKAIDVDFFGGDGDELKRLIDNSQL